MSDDDDTCPKPAIEEACKPECIKQLLAYQQCTKRIEGNPEAHCTGQYFDYWHCIDKCTAPRLFSVLK
jgi:ubiquinol-cytochrome c reductase subunit 6